MIKRLIFCLGAIFLLFSVYSGFACAEEKKPVTQIDQRIIIIRGDLNADLQITSLLYFDQDLLINGIFRNSSLRDDAELGIGQRVFQDNKTQLYLLFYARAIEKTKPNQESFQVGPSFWLTRELGPKIKLTIFSQYYFNLSQTGTNRFKFNPSLWYQLDKKFKVGVGSDSIIDGSKKFYFVGPVVSYQLSPSLSLEGSFNKMSGTFDGTMTRLTITHRF